MSSTKTKKEFPTPALIAFGTAAVTGIAMTEQSASAADAGAGGVNPDVTTAIDSASATAKALSPLALVCLSVALVPWASMLVLRFINMVLSRV